MLQVRLLAYGGCLGMLIFVSIFCQNAKLGGSPEHLNTTTITTKGNDTKSKYQARPPVQLFLEYFQQPKRTISLSLF